MLQGLFILAMLCVHLFDRYDYEGLYYPLIFVKGIPLTFYIGQLSDFCVVGFAFCSGYAHYKLYEADGSFYSHRLKSLIRLFIQYWVVVILFCGVSVAVGQKDFMPGSFRSFLGNLFVFDISYNGAWWYMYAYAGLVLLSPILMKAVKRWPFFSAAVSAVIYCLSYYLRLHYKGSDLIISKVGPFGMTLFEYMVGALFFRWSILSRLYEKWSLLNRLVRISLSTAIFLGLLFARTLLLPSMVFAPLSGLPLIIMFCFWEKPKATRQFFSLLGEHSTNIWLTHMFFYLVLFENLVYYAKYPALILVLMIVITILCSYVLQIFQKPLMKLIC